MRKKFLSIVLSAALLINNFFSGAVFAVDNETLNLLPESKTTVTEQAGDVKQSEGDIVLDNKLEECPSRISTMKLSSSMSDEGLYTITPEFNKDKFEYSLTIPDYQSGIYCYVESERAGDIIRYFPKKDDYIQYLTHKSGMWRRIPTDGELDVPYKVCEDMNKLTASASWPEVAVYNIHINKNATLSDLSINETMRPSRFDKAVQNYRAYVPEDEKKVIIKATGYSNDYTVNVGGIEGKSGEAIEVPVEWNDENKMEVKVVAIKEGMSSFEYMVTLMKESKSDTPTIISQPEAGQTYVDTIRDAEPIRLMASGNGKLTYQWYKNIKESTEGGALVDGATESVFTPKFQQVSKAETYYYYCLVTNINDSGSYTVASDIVNVIVKPDPTPYDVKIAPSDGSETKENGYIYTVGDNPTEMKVSFKTRADEDAEDSTISYTWWIKDEKGSGSGSGVKETYSFPTNRNFSRYVSCEVKIKIDGITYKTESNRVLHTVCATSVPKPTFRTNPISNEYVCNATDVLNLTVDTSLGIVGDNGTRILQWYVSEDNKNFEEIEGATQKVYRPELFSEPTKRYYKCKVTSSVDSYNGNKYSESAESEVATIEFKKLEDIVGEKLWEGDGSVSNPYLVKNMDDIYLIQRLVNEKGLNLSGIYFNIITDITLPVGWIPIGALKPGTSNTGKGKNIHPFSGILDGGSHTLTVADGGLPLFGYVRNATVKNMDIYGTKIEGYGLIENFTVDYGPTGEYSDWISIGGRTATIDNVNLKSGTQTLKSGFLGGAASAANTVDISNCTAEKGVIIGYDKSQSVIGSFAGTLAGTINNCHSYANVYGDSRVGGLVGSKGEAMGVSRVLNSSFQGNVEATGMYVGGIYGSGYTSPSAPNSPCVSVRNCYVVGNITGGKYVGGIIGAEPVVRQCWANGTGYIQNNYFYGTLSGEVVGGIIGYMCSLDRYNIITNNFFVDTCGTSRTVGQVDIIDTNAQISRDDAEYITTEAYCRTDDPLGAGADDLGKATTAAAFADGTVVEALNSGENSNLNWRQGEIFPEFGTGSMVYVTNIKVKGYKTEYSSLEDFTTEGIIVTAYISDGTSKEVDGEDVKFSGYINNPGTWAITATYEGCMEMFTVKVHQATDKEIASVVEEAIAAIGDVSLDSEEAIQIAREAYDALTDEQKKLVENYEILIAAEEALSILKVDREAADKVEEAIAAIGDVSFDSEGTIQIARTAYDALTGEQKKLVENYEILIAAEEALSILKVDREAADKVENIIEKIGKVTIESYGKIQAARKAYDALTNSQKKFVDNYIVLTTAEYRYKELKEEAVKPGAQEEGKPGNGEQESAIKPSKPNLPQTGAVVGGALMTICGIVTLGAGLAFLKKKNS